MSEESAPKFRLKVRTASEPAPVAPPTEAGTPVAESPAAPVTNESKAIRLKPRLAEAVVQEVAPVVVPEPRSVAADFPPPFPPARVPPPEPVVAEPPVAEKPEMKFKLRRKGSEPEPAAEAGATGAPAPEVAASTFQFPPDGPVPAPVFQDTEEGGGPAAVTSVRNVTAMPFPPRAGNFPPPANAARPPPPWAQVPAPAVVTKKNIFVWSGAVVVVLAVLGGGFFAYKKFTAEPPPPPPKAVPPPVEAKPAAPAVVEPAKQTVVAEKAPAEIPASVVASVPVAPLPIPASPEFEAWVKRLKIGGVRAGANPRVFIGGIAYTPGELVNPSLKIVFEGYDSETRMLTFRDAAGAKVERKN
jgi:hypothetical protein